MSEGTKKVVAVTGATGKTGMFVVEKLLQQSETIIARALVRSEAGKATLLGKFAGLDIRVVKDFTADDAQPSLQAAMEGADALIVTTGALPKIVLTSLPGVIFSKMFGGSKKPSFYFPPGLGPKEVEYEGTVRQYEAAKAAKVKHVIVCSSMAGCTPDHFLNTNMDKVVLWKRKAEKHLVDSGLAYTIVHPGGLLPHPGQKTSCRGGERVLKVGLDDSILEEGKNNLIPREDVAQVLVDAVTAEEARNRSFDLGSYEPGESVEGSEVYSSGNLASLLKGLDGKNADYAKPDLNALLA